jgi:hypothetical protein
MATICARPNCNKVVSQFKSLGIVSLRLESQFSENGPVLAVDDRGEICGNCSVDLADWWLRGKNS